MTAWSILQREIGGAVGDSRIRLILGVTLVVAVVGGTVTAQDYRSRLDQFATRSVQLRDARAKGRPMDVSTSDPGLRAVRPPEPGSLLARGLDSSLPSWWEFDPAGPVDGPPDVTLAEDSQSGSITDLEGLVRILLSLMALVFGFETVAGDRNRGVLQSVLNQPVSHRAVVTTKLAAGTALLGGAVLIVTGTFLITVSVVTPGAVNRSLTPLAAGIDTECLLYLLSLMASAMFIGSVRLSQTARVAAIGGLWTYVAILAPQFAVLGSRAVVPIPSRPLLEIDRQRSFQARLQDTERQIGRRYRTLIGDADMGLRPVPTPDAAGIAVLATEWHSEALETRQIVEAFDRRYDDLGRQRARVRSWLKWISPGSLLHEGTANLADTGTVAYDRWHGLIWAHQQYLNAAFFDNPPRVTLYVPEPDGTRPSLDIESFKAHSDVRARDLAAFEAAPTTWRPRVVASLPDLAGLAAYLAAAVLALYIAFPKAGV